MTPDMESLSRLSRRSARRIIHGFRLRLWKADGSGRPRIPKGDLDPVPYKPLWGEVEVNPGKRNADKEILRASERIEKKGFIINGIAKYI
jgi:hypothetical protein